MNAYALITEATDVNMTSKGQVLVPKAIRDRIGLIPGKSVRVGINDRGEVVILPGKAVPAETPAEKGARIRAAIDAMAGNYSLGMSTDEYMAEIRGPYPDPL